MIVNIEDGLLYKYAQNEAKTIAESGRASFRKIAVRTSLHLKIIEATAARITRWTGGRTLMASEFEWLLDNRYLIEREAKEAVLTLKKAGKTAAARGDGLPVAYHWALSLVRSGKNQVTAERIALFLQGAQSTRPLSEKELWMFAPLLKAALVEQVEEICGEMRHVLDGYRSEDAKNPFHAELTAARALEEGSAPAEAVEELAGLAAKVHTRLGQLLGQAVSSLRFLSGADLTEILQKSCAIETIFSQDPSGHYPQMDESSRAYYRQEVSRLARRTGQSEQETAQAVLELSRCADNERQRHVGYYLLEKPLGQERSLSGGRWYFAALIGVTLLLTVSMALLCRSGRAGVLLLLPISEMVKNIVHFVALRALRPRRLPKLELAHGIPARGMTLCVISSLLEKPTRATDLADLLEQYALTNRDAGGNLLFGLLCDYPDAKEAEKPEDAAALDAARKAIARLNEKYGNRFYLFLRPRVYHAPDKRYMSWERKRGALLELTRLLRGKTTEMQAMEGDSAPLRQVRYVITLDSDTRLTAGAAREMAGAMLHPLHRPVIAPGTRVVIEGHALMQPRVAIDLEAAGQNLFTRLMAGQGGLDPYCGAVSDIYQDLYGRASFVGKGIFDVDAFARILDGRLPENRILSHDLLEGEMLRAGLLGDIELSDGYPSHIQSWSRRMHRWTRGDFQIASWILPWVPGHKGKEKNPLSALSRFKIFDNLRRSMVFVSLFACILLGLAVKGNVLPVVALAALFTLLSPLLLSAGELAFRGGLGARYHSTIITGLPALLGQVFLQLVLLPYMAVLSVHAALVALYRVTVSKKHLLSWVTAEQAEARPKSTTQTGLALGYYRAQWFTLAAGVFCLFWGPVGWVLGAFWIVSPLIAFLFSRTPEKKADLPLADQTFLLDQAKLMWKYFEDFLTPDNHYLPPDNWQEQPAAGVAHRTSPTNIGLALLCILSAVDLQVTTSETALRLIEKMLTTLERLPKWNGHIYNWYDTRTLRPLHPRYISTVDSGNLVGCLIALREGLLELNDAAAEDLAMRADRLADETRFAPLYDVKRRLFYIGFDMELQKPTEGYYDLLASEARQTSYIAVARREVERKHWRRLGRALVEGDGYKGLASWTGTMFEYLMPQLLMPNYKNSLLYESMRFCVGQQIRRTQKQDIPWGISESCFYSFDNALNYQYKAHGVPRLAFKRGLGRELVISPYSSYLALMAAPRTAVSNLRRLQKMGMEGPYGLYEAVDFTPSRQTGSKGFERIGCFMSHHLGMSLLAIANLLRDNCMQKRFMRDREMGAYAELLQEKVALGSVTMKLPGREVPEKPSRTPSAGLHREGSISAAHRPVCHVLSNTSYLLFCTDTGLNLSTCTGLSLYRFEPRPTGGHGGMRFMAAGAFGTLSLTPSPYYQKSVAYTYAFDGGSARWEAEGLGVRTSVTARIPETEMAEWRMVTLENQGHEAMRLTLACYFEPVLAKQADFDAHPAFSKLFLETKIDGQTVAVTRRSRGDKAGTAMVFACDNAAVSFDTSREAALGRGGEESLPQAILSPATHSQGAVLDACVLAKIPLTIAPASSVTVRFALAVASVASDAYAAAVRTLEMPLSQPATGRMESLSKLLGLTAAESLGCYNILRDLVFSDVRQNAECTARNELDQSGLWKFGISGDLPILLVYCQDLRQQERLSRVIRQHRMLGLLGVASDLVVITQDGSDYRRPVRGVIFETLKALGADNLLGVSGGVFAVDLSLCSPAELTLLSACASRIFEDLEAVETNKPVATEPHVLPLKPPGWPLCKKGQPTLRYLEDGAFCFDTASGLPKASFSHLLANGSFGALVTDAGTGHMWRMNARENKMTPWQNDPLSLRGAEEIYLCWDEGETSLFAADDHCPLTVTYGFGYAKFVKKMSEGTMTTTLFVPCDRMARVLRVQTTGLPGAKLRYRSRILMGVGENAAKHVSLEQSEDGMIVARNGFNTAYNPQLYCLTANDRFTKVNLGSAEVSFELPLNAHGDDEQSVILVNGCACNEPGRKLLRELTEASVASRHLAATLAYWREKVCPFQADTPSEPLNRYLNGWALYQVLCTRLYARTSLYQCGGAFGFRDQLQDVCALVYSAPELVKRQIWRACAHQYEQGDVQHWWHPARLQPGYGDRGVRTKCSDDLLWLPYTVCEYLEKTGDESVLHVRLPYLESPPLEADEDDRFEIPKRGRERDSVYEHCLRAIDCVLHRGLGDHGLLFIGGGDWNDGLSMVGHKGKGESTWLNWFAAHVLTRFAPLCEKMGDARKSEEYRAWSDKLITLAHEAWDGEWYRRGYYDDGSTLGSARDEECQIDSLAQSFVPVVVDAAPASVKPALEKNMPVALASARTRLVDSEHKVIRLFAPSFADSPQNPGYIKGYVAGVRENGGQYTHGAVWLAMGHFLAGETEEGYRLLDMLLPATHDQTVYRVEPHVLAADVYHNAAHVGRGGWSLYTGAAAWYYRVAIEQLLGLRYRAGALHAVPQLPSQWRGYAFVLPDGQKITVDRTGQMTPEEKKEKKDNFTGKMTFSF